MYFRKYCKLKFKNKAKFCVQICPIFAGPVTIILQVVLLPMLSIYNVAIVIIPCCSR